MRHATRRAAFCLAAASLPAGRVAAAAWPERPVRLINTGAPGSGIDLVARIVAEGLSQHYRQPFPVENRPTGGMLPAGEAHATARAGESLLIAATGIASTLPLQHQGRLPFDPVADLVPVAVLASEFLCLAVPAASPARGPQDVLEQIRAQPGDLNWYCVPGFMELHFRLFLHERGLLAAHVAYRGSPPAVLDLVAGRIQLAIVPLSSALPAWRDGRVRLLAVTSTNRAPGAADVPTIGQAGVAELSYDPFTAMFGWRGMAGDVRDELSAATIRMVRAPDGRQRLSSAGLLPQGGSAEMLTDIIAAQRDRMEAAIRVLGRPPPA